MTKAGCPFTTYELFTSKPESDLMQNYPKEKNIHHVGFAFSSMQIQQLII